MFCRTNQQLWTRLLIAIAVLLLAAAPSLAQVFTSASRSREFEQILKAAASRLPGLTRTPDELANVAIVSTSVQRREVCGFTSPLTHYSFLVKVGPGEHDLIRLHRIMRETPDTKIFRPQPAIFMVHGGIWGFEGAFLSSARASTVPCDQSIAAYLANQEVDVWGIDLRWATLPAGTPNPAFLRDWGTDTDVHDIGVGMAVARAVRSVEKRGSDKLNLLGWSFGAFEIYAFANYETRFPEERRHTKSLIPVDMVFKFSPQDEDLRRNACQGIPAAQAELEGEPGYRTGDIPHSLGNLALSDPNGPSPFPGLTNRDLLLTVGAQTYLFFPIVPFYHFASGIFDATGKPIDLRYTRLAYMAEVEQQAAEFQSIKGSLEVLQTLCNETDVPWDNNLRQITVPVLYVGAEGGFGSYGLHTLTLLGGQDVRSHIVSFGPRPIAFGHSDLFWADNARAEVWSFIYDWLRAH
jgi:pimeloyl-ACP methyl ester carboxylesterase